MESFWSLLKTDVFPESEVFENKEAARQIIFEYIESYDHTQKMYWFHNDLILLAEKR